MKNSTAQVYKLNCACGKVQLELAGQPIVAMTCNCESCKTAGRRLAKRPGATTVLDSSDGTPYVMFRKDRLRCLSGETLLDEYRLKIETPTRRVVAACCNSPMFLDYTKGHWVSVYESRLRASNAPQSMPKPKTGLFIPRLMGTWMKMGFRTPRITCIKGQRHNMNA